MSATELIARRSFASRLLALVGASLPLIAAHASDAEPESLVLEEVTVTAEKSSRSLLDTATSVAVFDAEAIANRAGLESFNDILGRVSNVVDTGTTNLMPAIRGIDGTGPAQGRDAFLGGTRPRLAFQLDGRPLSYNESVFGDGALWDVQQAELLRGPQSSLQGRNSVGGLLAIRTKDPTYEWEGGGRLLGGNFEAGTGSFALSGPLWSDQLAFRVAFDHQQRVSWLPMADYDAAYFDNPPAPPEQVGNYYYDPALTLSGEPEDFIRDAGDFRSTTARLKLLFEPHAVEGFSALLTVNHADYSAPQGEWLYSAAEAVPGFSIPAGRFETRNGFIEAYPTFNARFNPRVTSATLLTRWERDSGLTFENTVAYADVTTRRISKEGDGNLIIEASELMIEPLVRFGARDARLKGLAGLYYYDNSQDEFIDFGFAAGPYDDQTTTAAAFTELSYALTDKLDLTLGGRYENEKRDRFGQAFFTVDFEAEYSVFMPKAVISFSPDDDTTFGATVNRGYNGGGAAFTFDPPFVNYEYDAEYVWNYEAFFRKNLPDSRMRLTANLFFTDYTDFQMPYDLNPGPEFAIVIVNGDEVQTYGLELGLTALLGPGLEVFADAGFLHAEVTSFPGGQVLEGNVLPPSEFEGNELARSPAFTGKVGANYRHPGGFELGFDLSYSGSYQSSILNRADEEVGSFWLANAQLGYRFGRTRVFGYVTNLFDSDKPVLIERASYDFDYNGTVDLANIATQSVLQPRTFMAGVEFTLSQDQPVVKSQPEPVMRRIGLIGGITWPATADYFRYINLDVRRRLGGDHSAEMLIRSLDLQPLLAQANDIPAVEQELLAAGRALQAGGAELIAVASFTGHRYIGPLRRLPLPFIDLVDTLGEQSWARSFRRIAVWATGFAAADEHLMSRLAERTGAELLLPERPVQAQLDRIVFGELAAQNLSGQSMEFLRQLLEQQIAAGAQALLLATTDFSPLAVRLRASVPILDASAIHCAALVDAALG